MFSVLVEGSLSEMIGSVYRALEAGSSGSNLRSGPDANEVRLQVPPYDYVGVGFRGPDLVLDYRGDDMITGTWTELRIESVRPASNGGIERDAYFVIRGFSADPSGLLGFVGSGLAGATYWRFDDAPLRAALDPGQSRITGGAGADLIAPVNIAFPGILSLRGQDTILGGGGDDTLRGGRGRDLVDGGTGADLVLGQGGDDRLSGRAGGDLLAGGTGNDTLSGGDHADRLGGGQGSDLLSGGGGKDTLDGMAGDDVLAGGAGADLFVFRAPGHDRVEDFSVLQDAFAIAPRLVPAEARADLAAWLVAQGAVTAEGVHIDLGQGISVLFAGVTDMETLAASAILA
ncbi:calcium-binding protein [Aliigemmobacter aestuarii]|uniref:Calcium-binding protein n=1 Tax=Aliigemmobacter aestuarii TaxID=1445661 RepID=A0A4S3MS32_9RHOB|nr:calcium-binding protein [Gemmobacter aestuarii]THD85257.1 calcium-binding protein [Gemmobacter aestuarii]